MSKSILVAVDVSESDHDADVLKTAHLLASAQGADLIVMTVVPNYGMSIVGSFFDTGFHDKLVDKTKESLEALWQKAIGSAHGDTVKLVVATGTAYEEILEFSKKIDCDLIVIGANKPELKDYLLGPNAARVVRHAQQSVYVVRSKAAA